MILKKAFRAVGLSRFWTCLSAKLVDKSTPNPASGWDDTAIRSLLLWRIITPLMEKWQKTGYIVYDSSFVRLYFCLVRVDMPKRVGELYVGIKHIGRKQVGGELKKGSAELLILFFFFFKQKTAYEIGKLIEMRS